MHLLSISLLKGEIRWHSDSRGSVQIIITKYAESITADIEQIIIEFHQDDSESVIVTATINQTWNASETNLSISVDIDIYVPR